MKRVYNFIGFIYIVLITQLLGVLAQWKLGNLAFLAYGQMTDVHQTASQLGTSRTLSTTKIRFRARFQDYRVIAQRLDQDFYFWSVLDRRDFLRAVIAEIEMRQNIALFMNMPSAAANSQTSDVTIQRGPTETLPVLNEEWLLNQRDDIFSPIQEFTSAQHQWIELLKSSHLYGTYNYLVSSNPRVSIAEARQRLLRPCYLPAFVNLTQNPLIASSVSFELAKTRYLATDFQCERFGDVRFSEALANLLPNLTGINRPALLALDVLQRARLEFFLSPSLARAINHMNQAGYYGYQELMRLSGVSSYNQMIPIQLDGLERLADPCWIGGFQNLTRILSLTRPQALAKLTHSNERQFWCDSERTQRIRDNLDLIHMPTAQWDQFIDAYGAENLADINFAHAFRHLTRPQPSLLANVEFRLNLLKDRSNRLFCSHPQFDQVLRILTNMTVRPQTYAVEYGDYPLLVALILHGTKDENRFLRGWRREFAQRELWHLDKPREGSTVLHYDYQRSGPALFLENGYAASAALVSAQLQFPQSNSPSIVAIVRHYAYVIKYLSRLRNYLSQLSVPEFWQSYTAFSQAGASSDIAFLFATRVRVADICRERTLTEYTGIARESMRGPNRSENPQASLSLQNPQWRSILVEIQRHCN